MKTLCLFEDQHYQNLLPLVYTRPVYDLRCGILTLREKIQKVFGHSKLILHTRKVLEKSVEEHNPQNEVNKYLQDEILFINGRLLVDKNNIREIKKLEKNTILISSNSIIAARLSGDDIKKLLKKDSEFLHFDFLELPATEISDQLINYAWDLVNHNGREIKNDYSLLVKKNSNNLFKNVEFKNKRQVYISKNVVIDPFVYFDASDGPIYIGKNARIMAHTFLQGPCFIGDDSIVKSHSKIYHDTSIGNVCKVGGEIEASIIHSFTNKQHEGYLGHSYLGSWVNLGADTNNSDLKNNYSHVSVLMNGENVDTSSQFVGLIMGDHSKTAINTMFNTGTIVGVSCNIFGSGFPPRNIPSFSWGGSDFLRTYDIKKSLEVARIVLNRRKMVLSNADVNLLSEIFETTKPERIKNN